MAPRILLVATNVDGSESDPTLVTGQSADELTRELARNFTGDIRLVSRNPSR